MEARRPVFLHRPEAFTDPLRAAARCVQPPRRIDIRGINFLQLPFRTDTREIGGKDFDTPLAGQIERFAKVATAASTLPWSMRAWPRA